MSFLLPTKHQLHLRQDIMAKGDIAT